MAIVIRSISAERAKELETMPDEESDYSDIPPLDEEFFKKAKRALLLFPYCTTKNRGAIKYHDSCQSPNGDGKTSLEPFPLGVNRWGARGDRCGDCGYFSIRLEGSA